MSRALLSLLPFFYSLSSTPTALLAQSKVGDASLTKIGDLSPALAQKISTYFLLLNTPGGTVKDYKQFLSVTNNWPNRAVLEKRMQQALAKEKDPTTLRTHCPTINIQLSSTLKTCLPHLSPQERVNTARNLWRKGILNPTADQKIIMDSALSITDQDRWIRFQTLLNTNRLKEAQSLLITLSTAYRPLASAWLGYKLKSPTADKYYEKLSVIHKDLPETVFLRAKWLRQQNNLTDAVTFWRTKALAITENSKQPRFQTERLTLARTLLDSNYPTLARQLLQGETPLTTFTRADFTFMLGRLALKEQKIKLAMQYFSSLSKSTDTNESLRGFFWLAMAQRQLHQHSEARTNFSRAAETPERFYGQMAIFLLNNVTNYVQTLSSTHLIAKHLPASDSDIVLNHTGTSLLEDERVLAGLWLANQGRSNDAQLFMAKVLAGLEGYPHKKQLALLTRSNEIYPVSVSIARQGLTRKQFLLEDGWPTPYSHIISASCQLPNNMVLALMRQESNFDPVASSFASAYGLMQLLVPTARDVAGSARKITAVDLLQPVTNIELGCAYLSKLMTQFHNVLPHALAGYNAGPVRAKRWLGNKESFRANNNVELLDLVEWIEDIPFDETRLYIMRVMENFYIYEAIRDYRTAKM